MKNILRYNGRHKLYFGGGLPQLNPLSSRYSGKEFDIYEPLWLFLLRKRLFCFAGRQRCPDRGEISSTVFKYHDDREFPDSWNYGADGNRTCSYCGSIHPDDLEKILELSKTDSRYGVEGTTKSYKCYVRQPNVRNAGEGAIKFYGWHAHSI